MKIQNSSPFPLSQQRELIYQLLEDEIGDTPLLEFKNINIPNGNRVFAKLEFKNPTGSHHMRIYPLLFRIAEHKGFIKPNITPVIEASIGNAGAAFAYSANKLGFNYPQKPTVIIPKDASKSRIQSLSELDANIIYSPAGLYSKGYVKLLTNILAKDKKVKGGKIGENPNRLVAITKIVPESRLAYHQLAKELLSSLSNQNITQIDYFFGAVGSGSSISGIGKSLKNANSNIKIIAVEPEEVPNAKNILETGKPLDFNLNPQEVQGVATFGVPINKLNIDFTVIDEYTTFSKATWTNTLQKVRMQEKVEIGASSAAVLGKILDYATKVKDKVFTLCIYDEYWKSI